MGETRACNSKMARERVDDEEGFLVGEKMRGGKAMAAHVSVGWWLVVAACLSCAAAERVGDPESQQQLEVRRHLKRFNKTPVKSIKSPDGDIIDCVHISHQPAFDHPFLKNHTIQMRPNFHPEKLLDDGKATSQKEAMVQQWHQNGRCPEDTIPIRRTTMNDVLRASSVKRYGRKKHKNIPNPLSFDPNLLNENNGHQHAIAYAEGEKYYGAKATINVWQPKVQESNEFSLSQLWILGGSFGEDLNSIEVGWQVSPDLYGDNYTRLFTYWTDPKEGHWWMQFGRDYVLGYWPSFLFSYLADSAPMIQWGGEAVNSEPDGAHTSTEMGSGHFAEEGYSKASYFRNIQIVDGSNNLRAPTRVGSFTEQSNCYNVQNGNNGEWGQYFYYGGPGRSSTCP
ncbi:uncharacterized protein LOC121976397 isoform X2 [Zingiber officinale]|uniref:uncharacterized protein LOC121976397 isoform X2 n=1 Tax=Zingiber officinale TaxID=94328 RepID=UPI001C4DD5C3|nr:uncharacterized protein LOC121976397 isoform X2 [Zingiber officinale]